MSCRMAQAPGQPPPWAASKLRVALTARWEMLKHSENPFGDGFDERDNTARRGRPKAQILLNVTSLSTASQHAE